MIYSNCDESKNVTVYITLGRSCSNLPSSDILKCSGENDLRRYFYDWDLAMSEVRVSHVTTLAVPSLRNVFDKFDTEDGLLLFLSEISSKKIQFIAEAERINADSSHASFVLDIIGAYRTCLSEERSANVRKGLESARQMGRILGRPTKIDSQKVKDLRDGGLTIQAIANTLNVSVGSVHRALSE